MSGSSFEKRFQDREADQWTIDDSTFDSYVSMVYFREGSAHECINRALSNNPDAVALDIAGGSNGRAIRDLIEVGTIKRGVYTRLMDNRTCEQNDDSVKFFPGDLLKEQTWVDLSAIQHEYAPSGFNLVLHRPYGGLQDLAVNQYIDSIQKILDMMCSKGIFYVQIPGSPYRNPDYKMLNIIYREVLSMQDVGKIEISDNTRTLNNYNFCLIYKK